MLDIKTLESGEITLSGRLDASQLEHVNQVFKQITSSTTINLENLDYISSAGVGLLLENQKCLKLSGNSLKLANRNKHIFMPMGFETIFEIT